MSNDMLNFQKKRFQWEKEHGEKMYELNLKMYENQLEQIKINKEYNAMGEMVHKQNNEINMLRQENKALKSILRGRDILMNYLGNKDDE